jgi:uncharacterized coiled-coil DUF342 family protein
MQEKDVSVEDLFKKLGKKKVPEATFVKWLTDLPGDIDRDEISAFSDERRAAIYKRLASGSGLTADDFAKIFQTDCNCVKPVTLTNQFAIEGGETICKVEPNTAVKLSGRQRIDEAKLTRSEAVVGDKSGWITIAQEKQRFLHTKSPFKDFCATMDAAVQEALGVISKVNASLGTKMKQGGPATEGPLKEARDEMAKLKDDIANAQKGMDELKSKAGKAKGDFSNKERAEKSAHIEARNRKEAAPFLAEPNAKVEALEADSKACEDAAAPMVSLSADELKTFATPASVLEAVEKHAAAVKEKLETAKAVLKEQTEAVAKVTPQSGGTSLAKKELGALKVKADAASSKANKTLNTIQQKCKSLTTSTMDSATDGIRKHAAKKGQTIEALFDSLKKGDKIPEAAFCKLLKSLELEPKISDEIAKLVCRKVEKDGVSKDKFMNFVVLYYKVVRTIAFTDSMDISVCKTLRKGDEGEIVEVLEGPVTDENTGMTRLRAKSMKGDDIVGWITLSGSKGTSFLEKCTKPSEKKPAPAAKPAAAKPAATPAAKEAEK